MSELAIELKHNAKKEESHLHDGPGVQLRKAREALRFSQADISQRLKVKLHFIQAIENEEYDKLPALTFVRGYLRLYAREVNLPADEIIDLFNQLDLQEKPSQFARPLLYKKEEMSHDKRLKWATYAVVGLLGILFLMWWFNERSPSAPQSIQQPPKLTINKPALQIAAPSAPVVTPTVEKSVAEKPTDKSDKPREAVKPVAAAAQVDKSEEKGSDQASLDDEEQ